MQDRIFDELNSLSVLYRAPAATFIDADQGEGACGEGGGWGPGAHVGQAARALCIYCC